MKSKLAKCKCKCKNKSLECRMCGQEIPFHYPAQHCWMCLRVLAESEYYRHYVLSDQGFYEEVQEIAGLSAFSKKDELTIKEAMMKKKQALKVQAIARKIKNHAPNNL